MGENNTHWWSGWPGAHCLKCGSEDLIENAIADNDYNCYPDENGNRVEIWNCSEEKKNEILSSYNYCPISNEQWRDRLIERFGEEKAKRMFPSLWENK